MTPAQETVRAVTSRFKERPGLLLFGAVVAITRAAAELLAQTDGADYGKVLRAAEVLREMRDADAATLTPFAAEYHARGMELVVGWAETECGEAPTHEAVERSLA